MIAQIGRQTFGSSDLHVPVRRIGGNPIQMGVASQQRRGRFGTPGGNTRKPVGGVSNQTQVVGDRLWSNAPLLPHSVLIDNDFTSSVEHDHPIANDALGQIFVRGENHDSLDIIGEPPGGCGQGVICLEFVHLPYHHPQRLQGPLGQRELRQDVRIQSLSGLVPVVQIVPKRSNHLVGGGCHVSDIGLAQQGQGGFD